MLFVVLGLKLDGVGPVDNRPSTNPSVRVVLAAFEDWKLN